MSDRDIEDTREPDFEEIDPDAMWDRIDDILDDELSDFVHDQVDTLDRKNAYLRNENTRLRNRVKELERQLPHLETSEDWMQDPILCKTTSPEKIVEKGDSQ